LRSKKAKREEGKEKPSLICYISSMSRSKKRAVLLLPFVAALLLCGCTLSNTPRRSLSELREALLNHDADRAFRYVDVDSIVECMVRDIFAKYEAKADDPLKVLGIRAGRKAAGLLMPGVKALAREQVREAILAPDEDGYFEYVRKGSVWYLEIEADGSTAIVKPVGKADTKFRMRQVEDGHWKIVEIMRE